MTLIFRALFWTVIAVSIFAGLTLLLEKYWRGSLRKWVRTRRFRRSVHGGKIPFFLVYIVWAVLGLGCAFLFTRPIFGLLAAPLAPFLAHRLLDSLEERRARVVQGSALSFLHALRGFLRMGLSLPAALFRLSETVPAAFSEALRAALDPFSQGRPLKECMHRFRTGTPLAQVGLCFRLLEIAHDRGLVLLPLLDQMLPRLQADQIRKDRLSELRRSLVAQALLAFSTPWILGATLSFFQPELFANFLGSSEMPFFVGMALAWELLGVWSLLHLTRFQ